MKSGFKFERAKGNAWFLRVWWYDWQVGTIQERAGCYCVTPNSFFKDAPQLFVFSAKDGKNYLKYVFNQRAKEGLPV